MNTDFRKIRRFTLLLTVGLTYILSIGCTHSESSNFYGNFEADETILPATATGKLLKIFVNEGDICEAEELLAIVDTTILTLEKAKVKSSIKALQEMGMFSQMVPLNYELRILEERIKMSYIKAPRRAKILKINYRINEYLFEGNPLMIIADIDRIYFTAWLPGESLYSLSAGDTVTVLSDRENGELTKYLGKVLSVSERPQFVPSMVQTRSNRTEQHYRVKIELKNDGTLKGGMPGELIPLIK